MKFVWKSNITDNTSGITGKLYNLTHLIVFFFLFFFLSGNRLKFYLRIYRRIWNELKQFQIKQLIKSNKTITFPMIKSKIANKNKEMLQTKRSITCLLDKASRRQMKQGFYLNNIGRERKWCNRKSITQVELNTKIIYQSLWRAGSCVMLFNYITIDDWSFGCWTVNRLILGGLLPVEKGLDERFF